MRIPFSARAGLIALALAALASVPAQATPIVAGQTLMPCVGVQTIDLYAGTPFNPGTETLTVVVTVRGSFLLDRQTQVGSTILFDIPQALFQGVLPGPLPPLSFNLIAGGPGLNPSTGQITDVVQDPLDPGFASGDPSSFLSGYYTAYAFFRLDIPGIGSVYSDPNTPAIFTAVFDGLPPSAGTVLSSPDRIDLYFGDTVIGQSYNRSLTVVPEPSTLALAGIGALLGLAGARRRRLSTTA